MTEIHNSLWQAEKNKDYFILTKRIPTYRKARKHYKQIEFFVEYFSGFDAKYFINGPPEKKGSLVNWGTKDRFC